MQTEFIAALTAKIESDPRIRAAWLAGSFGKGNADAYSDVDAHLLIDPGHIDKFRTGVRGWLEEIRPLVLYRLMVGGEMVNAMTVDALRLDIWLHAGARTEVIEGKVSVLYAEPDVLDWQPNPGNELSQEDAARELNRAIPEFWRCVAMLPVPLGRDERIICAGGNFIIVLLLTDVLSLATGIRKDRGVKALNEFLPPEYRQMVEEVMVLPELTPENLGRFQLRLARIMMEHGPAICEQWHVEYPQALEDAALAYVEKELKSMGLEAVLAEISATSERRQTTPNLEKG